MSVIVSTQNKNEEKVLLAFLNSLNYKYQTILDNQQEQNDKLFIDHYNNELKDSENEITSGNYSSQEDVEEFFNNRRKAL
ncbi:hypothetical protein [Pedobacter mucosus]|uniref:hypothetical protein n=1 Tax=Pedobacter mucosus TaxID=2895286 RepID=UPI001EE4A187|nr:hypothetical protein [Pedobacter mucosus]UKT64060.1 hypothetical protein LOK61_20115 [Pedobacter mucosus]